MRLSVYRNAQIQLDFTGPKIALSPEQFERMLDDLSPLDQFHPNLQHSEIILSDEQNTLTIHKDHVTANVSVNGIPTEDIYAQLTTTFGESVSRETFAAFFIRPSLGVEILSSGIKSLLRVQTAEPKFDAIREKVAAFENENANKYIELCITAAQIDAQLNNQKQKDQLRLLIGEMKVELQAIDDKLSQVSVLIEAEGRVDQALRRYAYLLDKDVDQDSQVFIRDIFEIRRTQLCIAASSDRQVLLRPDPAAQPKAISQAKFLLLTAFATIAFGFSITLLFQQLLAVPIGILSAAAQLGIWWGLNKISAEAIFNFQVLEGGNVRAATSQASLTEQLLNKLKFLERFFVDKAWVSALRSEKDNLNRLIKNKLDGLDYLKMIEQRKNMAALVQLLEAIYASAGKDIEPTDYLSKKRQLESARLDKIRVEGDLRDLEFYGELVDMSLEAIPDDDAQLVRGLIPGLPGNVDSVKLDRDDNISWSVGGNWVDKEPSLETLMLTFVVLMYELWSANQITPFIWAVSKASSDQMSESIRTYLSPKDGQTVIIELQ